MSIRARITVLATVAIGAVVTLVAAALYTAELRELRSQIDADLEVRGSQIAGELVTTGDPDVVLRPQFGAQIAYAQVVSSDGVVVTLAPGSPPLPVDDQTLSVAAGTGDRFFSSADVEEVDLRLLTVPLEGGRALQVARPVEELDLHVLRMSGILGAVLLSGYGAAMVLGRMVANAALSPVAKLTEAAEEVATTRDLAHRIEVGGHAELSGLARAMNEMLAALEASLGAQRRLVADASHELQTPLTVLKTNVEVMARADLLPAEERNALVSEVTAQIDDLSRLVTNLVDLARQGAPKTEWVAVELEEIVADAVRWAERAHPEAYFRVTTVPVWVLGQTDQIVRLVRNLLDNAARWTDRSVEITLAPGGLEVRDHGPGIEDHDLPHLFERFYRADSARGSRGAGLGLAIVDKVAGDHGWQVEAGNHPDGGARLAVSFPAIGSSHIHTVLSGDSQLRRVR